MELSKLHAANSSRALCRPQAAACNARDASKIAA
jgi:hypothetical protein